jgi:hypothetical protein
LQVALLTEDLARPHDGQPLVPSLGAQTKGASWHSDGLVDAHQRSAVGLANRAAKHFFATLSDHLISHHAKELFRSPVHAGNLQVAVVQQKCVRELIEDRLKDGARCQAGSGLEIICC